MKEIDVQKMIVDLVRERGGYAHKRSHKFLAGIADLLIKLPGHPAFIVEVKLRMMNGETIQSLMLNDVTELQRRDLRDAQNADMNGAVMSFLQTKDGKRSLYVGTFMIDTLDKDGFCVSTEQYGFIGRLNERDEALWNELRRVAQWQRT